MENKKVLLSIDDLHVKFRVRGRELTAIRGISLDIYENESIAIVGESGSGKSVFTKTFAGMLDSNGYVSNGKIIFSDEELSDTTVKVDSKAKSMMKTALTKLNEYSHLEFGADTYKEILNLESEKREKGCLTEEEKEKAAQEVKDLNLKKAEVFNYRSTLDNKTDKEEVKKATAEIKAIEAQLKELEKKNEQMAKEKEKAVSQDADYMKSYNDRMSALRAKYAEEIKKEISAETIVRNEILAKEIYLSIGRYDYFKRVKLNAGLLDALKKAMQMGVDLNNEELRNAVFDDVAFRVRYLDETPEQIHGTCILNLANVKYAKDWSKIRGGKIATVFQDPMTSLNPIITIGKQITSIIKKHQDCTDLEARERALDLMKKVGIPKPEARFDDYPFQYSGGMRQRIVIAIALSCQPKILICDEPTTALDVTIQAQILDLMKKIQKEEQSSILLITHDLGVVAEMCSRVIVMYAGKIVEEAPVEILFGNPSHPYTQGLIASVPKLGSGVKVLPSIPGSVPDLAAMPEGCRFAPRCKYATEKCRKENPELFQIGENHKCRCWLMDK